MNKKITILIILSALMAFVVALLILDMNHSAVNNNALRIDSSESNRLNMVTIPLAQLDSLRISSHDTSQDFSTKLNGRFVLKGAEYAGFNFYSPTRITWINEMDAWHPDSLKIRWINHTTFYTRNVLQLKDACSPIIGIYQVVFFDGQHLVLNEFSTSWNDHPDSHLEFYRNDALED